jgi:hypothetical protein
MRGESKADTSQAAELLFFNVSIYNALDGDKKGRGDINDEVEASVELFFHDESNPEEDAVDFCASCEDISDFVADDIIPKALQPKGKWPCCLSGLADHAKLRKARQAAAFADLNVCQNIQVEAEEATVRDAEERSSKCKSTTHTALHPRPTSFKHTEAVNSAHSLKIQWSMMMIAKAKDGP